MGSGPTLRTLLAAAGLVALGFWLAPRAPAAPAPVAVRAAAPTHVSARADLDVRALRDEIRAAVRDELGAPVTAEHVVTSDEAGPPPIPPNDEQIAAAEQADAYVAQVFARGQLTQDDAMSLRPILAAMDFEDAMAVRLSIAQAINEQRLVPEGALALP